MPDTRYVLAIDLGTGGPKVALVSTRGEIFAHETEDLSITFLEDGGAEQDARDWWDSIVRATRRILARTSIPRENIIAASVTTQWSLTVPVDKNGEPLMNAICWMDTRGARYCRALKDGLVKIAGCEVTRLIRWLRLTGGCPTDTGFDSLAHVLFIKNERPDVYKATYKFLEPMDYINLRLTGKFAACYSGVFSLWLADTRDIGKLKYDEGLLRLAGLDREKFAELTPPLTVLGTITPGAAEELGLHTGVQVIIGTGDNHSATVGSGATRDYEGHCYVGTTSWLSAHVPFKKIDIFHLITSMPAAVPGRNIVLAQQGTGGECFKFLKENILYRDDVCATGSAPEDAYERMNELAKTAPPGSDGLMFTPFLTGAMTPINERHTRSAFVNQSLSTNRAHYVRAVMEGVAFNLRWLLPYVEKFIGRRFESLNYIGGGAQSGTWCQIMADVLDRPIHQMAEPRQANVRGAGLLASLALGIIRMDEVPGLVPVMNTFAPNAENRGIYDEMAREFIKFSTRNRGMYRRLNRDGGQFAKK
ncbi:MAG: FGGY-family carbohydrate kinase [Candidatus Hydrogenedentes bacterium]|nr:FGGY-family carbohydrate kinase [Candidatus Hydrogenedentota bacterium]